jgi:hypothetical protein
LIGVKKETLYKKAVEDLYNEDILNDDDIKSIEKDSHEL